MAMTELYDIMCTFRTSISMTLGECGQGYSGSWECCFRWLTIKITMMMMHIQAQRTRSLDAFWYIAKAQCNAQLDKVRMRSAAQGQCNGGCLRAPSV